VLSSPLFSKKYAWTVRAMEVPKGLDEGGSTAQIFMTLYYELLVISPQLAPHFH